MPKPPLAPMVAGPYPLNLAPLLTVRLLPEELSPMKMPTSPALAVKRELDPEISNELLLAPVVPT